MPDLDGPSPRQVRGDAGERRGQARPPRAPDHHDAPALGGAGEEGDRVVAAARRSGGAHAVTVTVLRRSPRRSGPHGHRQPASPPATGRTVPVMYDASSDARKQIAAACSSRVPYRPISDEDVV